MSQASDDQFDKFAAQAEEKQIVVIYLCAILPSGECVQISTELMPEALEEIGPMPAAAKALNQKEIDSINQKLVQRGQTIARVMNSVINPLVRVTIEELVRKHYAKPKE